MHPSVIAHFPTFNELLEGYVCCLYADRKGLITIGVGDLRDPIDAALELPLYRPDKSLASRAEIAEEWKRVKAATCGGCEKNMDACPKDCISRLGWRAAWKITTLRMSGGDIADLVQKKLLGNESILRTFFPTWDAWPADAQLALMSWAYAVGPRAAYPRMRAYLLDGKFGGAAEEVDVNPKIGTIPERNRLNRKLLGNAQVVVDRDLDRSVIYWPRDLVREGPPAP